jgi:hypothetical protein
VDPWIFRGSQSASSLFIANARTLIEVSKDRSAARWDDESRGAECRVD